MKTCTVCNEDYEEVFLCEDCSGIYYEKCEAGSASWVERVVCCNCCSCQPKAVVLTQARYLNQPIIENQKA